MDYTIETVADRAWDRAQDRAAEDAAYAEKWWKELHNAGLMALQAIKGLHAAGLTHYSMMSGETPFGIDEIEDAAELLARLDLERTRNAVIAARTAEIFDGDQL